METPFENCKGCPKLRPRKTGEMTVFNSVTNRYRVDRVSIDAPCFVLSGKMKANADPFEVFENSKG